jgi:hypothetical protein
MFIQVFTQDRLSTAVVVMTSHSNKEWACDLSWYNQNEAQELFYLFETNLAMVAQAGLKFKIFLPQPPT